MRGTLSIMKFHQLEGWCRANIDSQWMMLKRSFSDLLDTMRMTMGPRRMCPLTFNLWRCVPRIIRPLDDMSLRWFIAGNKHPMDYMSHGRMIPDQCVQTQSVREEISQHRTTDEMSPNTTLYIFPCVYIHHVWPDLTYQNNLNNLFILYLHLNKDLRKTKILHFNVNLENMIKMTRKIRGHFLSSSIHCNLSLGE